MAGNVTEHLSEPGGHEVVEDGVNGGAQVEEDPRDDVDVFEELVPLVGRGVDVAPHQAVHVKGSPAEAKHHHQYTCNDRLIDDRQMKAHTYTSPSAFVTPNTGV